MKKNFEIPELTIIYFTGDLATYDIMSTSGPGNGYGDNPQDEYED